MNSEKICCPPFDPTQWNEKTLEWNNKKFIKDKVFTLFYIPINFGSVMTRCVTKIQQAGANIPEGLILSEHTSKWNTDIFVAVDKEIPNAENSTISGKFFCKVYEGEFKDTGTWMKNMKETLDQKGLPSDKLYMWYTTCPKCAKKYGKNYVAILAKI